MPRPRQVGHGDVRTICPNIVRATCCTWPWPWQVGQRVGCDGGSGAGALAVVAGREHLDHDLLARAERGLHEVELDVGLRVRAGHRPATLGGRRPPPNRSSPNSIEKMSAMLPLW